MPEEVRASESVERTVSRLGGPAPSSCNRLFRAAVCLSSDGSTRCTGRLQQKARAVDVKACLAISRTCSTSLDASRPLLPPPPLPSAATLHQDHPARTRLQDAHHRIRPCRPRRRRVGLVRRERPHQGLVPGLRPGRLALAGRVLCPLVRLCSLLLGRARARLPHSEVRRWPGGFRGAAEATRSTSAHSVVARSGSVLERTARCAAWTRAACASLHVLRARRSRRRGAPSCSPHLARSRGRPAQPSLAQEPTR